MITLNPNTKRAQNLLRSVRYFKGYQLSDVYGTYSHEKANAYDRCLKLCYIDEDGTDFHIYASNCNTFSVAWNSPKGVRIETRYASYLIPGEKIELIF
jgi:hypothetical protein